ncbi:MAG: hypothetical protein AB7K24_24200 [Gemmataceae bacterium]
MRSTIIVCAALLMLAESTRAAEPVKWVKPPALSFDEQAKKWVVTFELSALTDVEVALLDPQTKKVVRHLAAGVLGPKAPAPLAANARAQRLEWDGLDDLRRPVARPGELSVRVRAGMSVALEQIVGGNPYAYYSEDMRHYDHGPWGINGLEVKADGKVYVLGHSSNLGPPALRQYDSEGNFLRTLFPIPAGKDPQTMSGWGLRLKPDGTYAPSFNKLTDPSLTETLLDPGHLQMARLMPTPDPKHLQLWRTGAGKDAFELLTINNDGTIASDAAERSPGLMIKNPPLPLGLVESGGVLAQSLLGPVFTCYSPDGKSFYLSGVFAAHTRYGSIQEIKADGFWRDGQVFKVDLATRTARPFFALPADKVPTDLKERLRVFGGANSYAALHGVAVDQDENVFIGDRVNKRIVVLDKNGKQIRVLPVEHVDAIAVGKAGNLYATTRMGDYHAPGVVQLLKFNNWRKDDKPAAALEVSKTGYTGQHKHSYVAVCETDKGTNVWVAYTQMPVRVYRDDDKGLALLKDFYRVEGAQRCLGFDRMQVDPQTEDVYVLDAHDALWQIGNWKEPRTIKVPLKTATIAIDARRRHLFIRTLADGASSYSVGKVARYQLDRDDFPPVNFGDTGSNRLSGPIKYEWCFEGNADAGLAVAPNGNVAVVGEPRDGLRVFAGREDKVPWEAVTIAKLPALAGGVRFDLAGNLYVGIVDGKPPTLPGFEKDRFRTNIGRIHKYAPTGTLESGKLFPKPPAAPAQIYDVPFGAFEIDCVKRSPRFGVDGYGRLYYPTNIAQRVAVCDNAGNEILHFGTYGNRDSTGGLPGDLVPTKGIPLAFPNSVDASDDFVYVADMVNQRVLRLRKRFQVEAASR